MEPPVIISTVRYFPTAIADADAALVRLVDEIVWRDDMSARRTASFGRPYNYSGQSYPEAAMPPTIRAIAERAAGLAGHDFNNCLCNLYESGRNRMGFHYDSYDELHDTSSIAIASLGATRRLVFRSRDRSHQVSYALEHGSILMMNRETHQGWLHAVPPEPHSGRRISLTFRRFRASSSN
jgi:alkylated DNA repair dioxygenase AlkB